MPVPIPDGAQVGEPDSGGGGVPIPQGASVGEAPPDQQNINSDIDTEHAVRAGFEDVTGAVKGLGQMAAAPAIHLKNAVTSLAHGEYADAAMHFIHSLADDPASQIVDQQLQSSKMAKDRMMESAKKGDTAGAMQHAAGMVPGANQVDSAMTNYQEQPSRANLAHIITAAVPLLIPGAVKAAGDIGEAIPSAERAGAAFEDVKAAAGDVQLSGGKFGKASDTVGELMKQGERGAPPPQAVKQLSARIESGKPLTYEEAKDFQSNISALSAEEKMGMSPNTKRLVGKLNQDLKGALEDAADTKGKGEQFTKAMKEYHDAMRLSEMSDKVKAHAMKAAAVSAIGATGYGLYRELFK